MGNPKRARKKYRRPLSTWKKELIQDQRVLMQEYGLKNKKEIYRAEALLKNLRSQAKSLIASKTEQAKKEKEQLINRLVKIGLIKPSAQLEDVLALNLQNILDRRLQTIVHQKNISKTIKQARQFIVHGHVAVNENKVDVPSFIVTLPLESKITFNPASRLSSEQHPERVKERSKKQKLSKREKADELDIFSKDTEEKLIKKEGEEKVKKTARPVRKRPQRTAAVREKKIIK